MQKFLFPAFLATGLALSGPAIAAGEAGQLVSVNPVTEEITFANGDVVAFPYSPKIEASLSGLRSGEMAVVDVVGHTGGVKTANMIRRIDPVFGYPLP